ncbi:LOW QUALITY PROTEIN: hypothetical protein Nmel_005562 [Mimus melanotis]
MLPQQPHRAAQLLSWGELPLLLWAVVGHSCLTREHRRLGAHPALCPSILSLHRTRKPERATEVSLLTFLPSSLAQGRTLGTMRLERLTEGLKKADPKRGLVMYKELTSPQSGKERQPLRLARLCSLVPQVCAAVAAWGRVSPGLASSGPWALEEAVWRQRAYAAATAWRRAGLGLGQLLPTTLPSADCLPGVWHGSPRLLRQGRAGQGRTGKGRARQAAGTGSSHHEVTALALCSPVGPSWGCLGTRPGSLWLQQGTLWATVQESCSAWEERERL